MAEGSNKKMFARQVAGLMVLVLFGAIGYAASLSVTAPTGTITGNTTITFSYAGFDSNAQADIYYSDSIGGKDNSIQQNFDLSSCASPCDKSWDTTAITGDYYIDVQITDDSNNDKTESSAKVTIDNSDPTITSVSPSDGSYTNDATPMIEANFSDTGSGIDSGTIEMKLDGNVVAHTYSTDKAYYVPSSPLSQGSHTVYVQADDLAGNNVEKTWGFTLDSIAPSFTQDPSHDATSTLRKGQALTVTAKSETGLDASFTIEGIVTKKSMTESAGTYTGTYTIAAGDEATDAKVTVYLEDDAGNETSKDTNDTVSINGITPTSVSLKINDGASTTRSRSVTLNISATNATHCRYKNSGASYGDWLSYTTSKSWSISSGDGTKTVYMQCGKKVGSGYNTASEVSDSIKLDNDPPSKPTGVTAEAKAGGKIKITWDDVSGAKKYKVYRAKSSFDDTDDASLVETLEEGDDYGSDEDEISYTDSGLSDGVKYYYRIKALDSAGNKSDLSSQVYATAISDCKASTITIDLPSTVSPGVIGIKVTTSDDVRYARLTADPPGTGASTLFSNKEGTSFNANYNVPSVEGKLVIAFSAEDDFGNECKKFASTDIVDTPLAVSFSMLAEGDIVSGTAALKAKTIKGIKVGFYYLSGTEWAFIGEDTTRGLNDTFETAWDTILLDGGSYSIKAVAKDSTGEEVTAEISIVVENDIEGMNSALAGLDEAKALRAALDSTITDYNVGLLLVLPDLNNDYTLAIGWLNEAQALYEQRLYDVALTKAEKARQAFEDMDSMVPEDVEIKTGQESYELGADYEGVLSGYGLASLYSATSPYLDKLELTRELKAIELEGDTDLYTAEVTVTAKNNAFESFNGELVEIIPKELADSIDYLVIEGVHTVIEEDPVIKWPVSLEAGSTAVYSYKVLAREEEISTQLLEEYEMPLIVKGTVQDVELPTGTWKWVAAVVGTVLGIGILAAIILVAIAYAVRSAGSRPRNVKPSAPGKRTEAGDLASASRLVDGFAPRKREKIEPRNPKFAYKEP